MFRYLLFADLGNLVVRHSRQVSRVKLLVIVLGATKLAGSNRLWLLFNGYCLWSEVLLRSLWCSSTAGFACVCLVDYSSRLRYKSQVARTLLSLFVCPVYSHWKRRIHIVLLVDYFFSFVVNLFLTLSFRLRCLNFSRDSNKVEELFMLLVKRNLVFYFLHFWIILLLFFFEFINLVIQVFNLFQDTLYFFISLVWFGL